MTAECVIETQCDRYSAHSQHFPLTWSHYTLSDWVSSSLLGKFLAAVQNEATRSCVGCLIPGEQGYIRMREAAGDGPWMRAD